MNRHKAFAQREDFLEEYKERYVAEHGEDAWKRQAGSLEVESAKRVYTVRKQKGRDNHSPVAMLDRGRESVIFHNGDTVVYEEHFKNSKKIQEVFVVEAVRSSKQSLVHTSKRTGKTTDKQAKYCKKSRSGSIVQTGTAYHYKP